MAHHHQRDLINNDDAADRLKLPVHAPPPPVATGAMPSPLALPPPALTPACPAVSPRNTGDGVFQPPPPPDATAATEDQAPLLPPPAAATSDPAPAVTAPTAAAPARCASCRKRLGLAGFRCRCGSLFCGVHRYSDRHACTFDYKAQAREAIARDNPAYKAPKLLRI